MIGRDDEVEWSAETVGDPVALAISQLIAAVIEVTPTDCPERKRASRPTEGSADCPVFFGGVRGRLTGCKIVPLPPD
jgi:hypothetical protein